MTIKPSPERLQRVFELRDSAVAIIRQAGKWQKVGPLRVMVAESGGLKIIYQSPFNVVKPDLSAAPSYVHEEARRRMAPDLPHKLV